MGFVVAALGEAVVVHWGRPGPMVLGLTGAPLLGVLAVRRTRAALTICVIATAAVVGSVVQRQLWPGVGDGGGVWLFALMFAAYSVGVHVRGRAVVLGGLLPLLVGLSIDLPTMSGWALVNGGLFLTAFVGILPTVVGRAVHVRRERLAILEEQRVQILREQQSRREAAVLDERLRAVERLQPALLDGLRQLARQAEEGAEPHTIEQAARLLLGRAREEVLELTARVDLPVPPATPRPDDLAARRAAAQPWSVLGAGAIGAGLALESTGTLTLSVPEPVAVLLSLAVGAPLALAWRWPLASVATAWAVAGLYSPLVAPLDGTLSATALAVGAAFAVSILCSRGVALVGLLVCWAGQLIGIGAQDPLGAVVLTSVCWLGGQAVADISTLVEQSRANNAELDGHEELIRARALVEERLRLAHDLHDEIGHSLTVVALQAAAARRISAGDPDRAASVMETIAMVARDSVAAMTGGTDGWDLAALVEHTRSAGLDVTADIADIADTGSLDTVTREVACRIVQESLTNALRHAPGTHVRVTARRDGPALVVTVRNSAPTCLGPSADRGSGRGLPGLLARVSRRAGQLTWGTCPDGGFEVSARLPVERVEPLEDVVR
jgi:signal transduction histidine kinase